MAIREAATARAGRQAALADRTGAPLAVGVAGSLCLLFAGLAALRLPSMRAL